MKGSGEYNNRVTAGIKVFDKFYQEYDAWFTRHEWVYRSEIEVIRRIIPQKGLGLEVGVGTGRFSIPFGIEIGVDPSLSMVSIAGKRGIKLVCGVGEKLPFRGEVFDFVLNVTTICFVEDPFITLKETKRVLKKGGSVIIGFVDKESRLGKLYEAKKEKNKFYQPATFYSVEDVRRWLTRLSFTDFSIYQTIFNNLDEINDIEPVREGYGEGGFVAFKAKKVEK